MSKLLNKYETRIKNFVYKMSENPYIIKKYQGVYTPKHPSPIPISDTFYQKNAFSFKKYKSDRERIDEILEKNAILEEYYKKMNKEKERLKKLYQIKFAPKLVQPNMHFQSKNHDSIINKKLAKKIKELTTRSKSVDNYNIDETDNNNTKSNYLFNKDIDKTKSNLTNRSEDNLTEEQIRLKSLHKKILEDRKNMIETRKLLMNLEGGNTEKQNNLYSLGEIYRKTEFKAMENLRMFKTSTMNKSILKKWEKEDEEKQMNIRLINIMNLSDNKIPILNKSLTRNNKSNFEIIKEKYNTTNDKREKSPILKKINSTDEFDINNHRDEIYANINYRDMHNFNIIKEKPYIAKRRKKLSENNKTLKSFNITRDISKINPLLYTLFFIDNDFKNNKIGINVDQFNQIKNLAFNDNKKKEAINNDINEKDNDDTNDETNYYNNGKKIKKLSVDKLAEKILSETNWTLKNKYKAKYDLLNKE